MPYITSFDKIKKASSPQKSFKNMGHDPIYNNGSWRRLSKIKKLLNPICEVKDCFQPVHTVDHVIPIKVGGAFLDLDNLQSLCRKHNFSKTAKQKGQ